MKVFKGIIILSLVVIFLMSLTGCPKRGAVGVIGAATAIGAIGAKIGMDAAKGETQTFQGREVLTLPEARPDIVDIIIDVGKALNYRVAGWDKERGIVRLDMTNSFAAKEFLGKFTKIHLIIHVKDGGGKLDLNIMVAGNYRTGTEQTAETFLEIFKNKLFERINRGSRIP